MPKSPSSQANRLSHMRKTKLDPNQRALDLEDIDDKEQDTREVQDFKQFQRRGRNGRKYLICNSVIAAGYGVCCIAILYLSLFVRYRRVTISQSLEILDREIGMRDCLVRIAPVSLKLSLEGQGFSELTSNQIESTRVELLELSTNLSSNLTHYRTTLNLRKNTKMTQMEKSES